MNLSPSATVVVLGLACLQGRVPELGTAPNRILPTVHWGKDDDHERLCPIQLGIVPWSPATISAGWVSRKFFAASPGVIARTSDHGVRDFA
jgi:hypothetical protein